MSKQARDRQPKATWIRVEWMDGRKPEYHKSIAAFRRAHNLSTRNAYTAWNGFRIKHTDWLVRGKWIPLPIGWRYIHGSAAWYLYDYGTVSTDNNAGTVVAYCPIIPPPVPDEIKKMLAAKRI